MLVDIFPSNITAQQCLPSIKLTDFHWKSFGLIQLNNQPAHDKVEEENSNFLAKAVMKNKTFEYLSEIAAAQIKFQSRIGRQFIYSRSAREWRGLAVGRVANE